RSRPSSCALRNAVCVGMISVVPSGNTARTSRARIDSLTFSLRFCRRGGRLRGYIVNHALARGGVENAPKRGLCGIAGWFKAKQAYRLRLVLSVRSEERRVGKECRGWWVK